MLCSDPPRKSSSKWLDRLRSSKGFPPGTDDLDLDRFLTHQNPTLPNSPQTGPQFSSGPTQPPQSSDIPNPDEGKQLLNTMSNVLAELFAFGPGTSKIQSKKACRKQANPRICNVNKNNNHNDTNSSGELALRKNENASPMSDDNSRVEVKESTDQAKEIADKQDLNNGGEEEEEEKRELSLSGYSRTDVTVIDTSCSGWKFEKLLFRKKNVWRVRDKKNKVVNFGKKKKKRKDSAMRDHGVCNAKKQIVSDAQYGSSSKEGFGGECTYPANAEAHLQRAKLEEASRRSSNIVCEVSKRKLHKGSPSVIIIKSIPTSKKSGASTSRSCVKPPSKQLKS